MKINNVFLGFVFVDGAFYMRALERISSDLAVLHTANSYLMVERVTLKVRAKKCEQSGQLNLWDDVDILCWRVCQSEYDHCSSADVSKAVQNGK